MAISAPLAHKLMGYYDLVLSKDEQAAYDYAMESARIIIPANNSSPLGMLAKAAAGPLIPKCANATVERAWNSNSLVEFFPLIP